MKMSFSFSTQLYLTCLFLTLVVAIGATTYIFLVKKDYYYQVEAPCDPEQESCFYRDCSEEDACYDYEEEIYKIYRLQAGDFKECISNSCQVKCTEGSIACEEIFCDPESDEEGCYDGSSVMSDEETETNDISETSEPEE